MTTAVTIMVNAGESTAVTVTRVQGEKKTELMRVDQGRTEVFYLTATDGLLLTEEQGVNLPHGAGGDAPLPPSRT